MRLTVNGLEIEVKPIWCMVKNHKHSGKINVTLEMTTTTFLSNYQAEKVGDLIQQTLREV